jgi:hypothetical protein
MSIGSDANLNEEILVEQQAEKQVDDVNNFDKEETEQSSKQNTGSKKKRKSSESRPFPVNSIEEAVSIPRTIKQYNGGNPWTPDDIAKALNMGTGNNFYYLTASSRDYGFTIGTRSTKKIELDTIGRQLVYAKSKEEEIEAYQQAFFKIQLFSAVYDYYSGGNLPELEYLKNTLITVFGIHEKYHEDFYKLYQFNLKLLQERGITKALEQNSNDPANNISSKNSIAIVGEPDKKTSLVAFVAMPFSEKTGDYQLGFFEEVLRHLITPAAVQAGFKAEIAKKSGSDVIQATIINDLSNADLVIADLTEHNPNVLFELGWRMACNKPVALIRAKGTRPIFDVDHMLRVYDYDGRLWKSTLEKDIPELAAHIKATWENKDRDKSYYKILVGQ